jgi:hypothetical protein
MRLSTGLPKIVAGVFVALCAGGIVATGFHAKAQSTQHSAAARTLSPLVGTWRVTVQLQSCQAQTSIGIPFYSILSFESGGVMGGTTANSAFLPGQRSSDFGAWQRTDRSVYSATDEAFIVISGGPFAPGVQTIHHTITLAEDGNSFTDNATTQYSDFNDTQTTPPPGCATAVGKRLE